MDRYEEYKGMWDDKEKDMKTKRFNIDVSHKPSQ